MDVSEFTDETDTVKEKNAGSMHTNKQNTYSSFKRSFVSRIARNSFTVVESFGYHKYIPRYKACGAVVFLI